MHVKLVWKSIKCNERIILLHLNYFDLLAYRNPKMKSGNPNINVNGTFSRRITKAKNTWLKVQ